MAKYPQLVFNLTDGNADKNISFSGVKSQLEENDVRALGLELKNSQGNAYTYVKADLITSENIDTND